MRKKRIYIIILMITQGFLIKVVPQYWWIFLLIGTLFLRQILISYEREVTEASIIKKNYYNILDTHFLFNAISTIMYFCRVDGNKARELLLSLGDYLRYALSEKDNSMKLLEEYRILHGYLNIQQARFEDRITFSIEKSQMEFLINKGFLVDLTYYALKEGLLKSKIGGELKVESTVDEKSISILLIHDGNSLENLNEYSKIYSEKYGYRLKGSLKDGNKTELKIEIPLNNAFKERDYA